VFFLFFYFFWTGKRCVFCFTFCQYLSRRIGVLLLFVAKILDELLVGKCWTHTKFDWDFLGTHTFRQGGAPVGIGVVLLLPVGLCLRTRLAA
jgi:hypothetical protein